MLIYENEGDSTTTSSLAQCAVIRYVRDGQTDRQRDGQKQRLLPLPYGRGRNNRKSCIASYARNWTQAIRKLAVKYRHRTNCPKRNFFAAIRGSVRVRTPPRGSDRVRSTGWCQFSKKKSPPSSVLLQQKWAYDLEDFVRGVGGEVCLQK